MLKISFEKNSKSVNNPNLDDVEFWETDVIFALDNIEFPVFAEEIGLNIEEKPITSKEQAIALGKQIIDNTKGVVARLHFLLSKNIKKNRQKKNVFVSVIAISPVLWYYLIYTY